MNPYHLFLSDLVRNIELAKCFRLGEYSSTSTIVIPESAPIVLIFSPHPDDECITGALPLRLFREEKMKVIVVPVTFGSDKTQRQRRYDELCGACNYLGFSLSIAQDGGFEQITPESRRTDTRSWDEYATRISHLLESHRPKIILFPHSEDQHSTHKGVHFLISDALAKTNYDFSCFIAETEYWRPITEPNLMIESGFDDVVDLITALSFHAGEVKRNPYHISLPSWMIDNVRRGSEIVGKHEGGKAEDFQFATLYRFRQWKAGQLTEVYAGGRRMSAKDRLFQLF